MDLTQVEPCRFRLAVVGLALVAGVATNCGTPTDPLPNNAIPLTPTPASYRTLWQEVETCSGKTGDFNSIAWFHVPNVGVFTVGSTNNYEGYWQPARHSITLAGLKIYDSAVVRHEELHAILQRTDHPAEFFQQKCGALVSATSGADTP